MDLSRKSGQRWGIDSLSWLFDLLFVAIGTWYFVRRDFKA